MGGGGLDPQPGRSHAGDKGIDCLQRGGIVLAIVIMALAVANFLGMILLIVYELTSGVRARYRRARDLDSMHRGLMGVLSIMRHSDLGRDDSARCGGGHDHGGFGDHDFGGHELHGSL